MVYNVVMQNFEKNNLINEKIYERVIPSDDLILNFDPRPVQTKYTHMPILDTLKNSSVTLKDSNIFNPTNIFSGNAKPNFRGFVDAIDKESTLRNQFFALQKSDQSKFIPSTQSSLYNNEVFHLTSNEDLDNSLLFNEENFNNFNPNLNNKIGANRFNNSTRVQLKNL